MNITRNMFAAVVGALALAWCGIAAEGTGETIFSIDAGNPGKTLPNVSKMLTIWELQESTFANVKRRNDADVLEFVEYVEVMGATGGNDGRDCLKDPANRAVFDDYDFSRLVAGCRNIVRLGLRPYLKLGNVPRKFSSSINFGEFAMNIRPPLDYDVYGRYMAACAKALLDAFGRDELLTWRFAVLTEFENGGWFKDASGSAEKTFQAYCRLYEVTVDAFTRTISPDLTFGAHAMAVTEGLWDERNFIKYAAERRIPLKFVTASFYDFNPGRFTRGFNLPNTIGHLRNAAESVGLTNLVYGIDEGRILSGLARGANSRALALRVVGDTYQAAYDARIVKQLFDSNADYFAAWGYLSGPHTGFDGLPSVSFHVARESAKFKGMRRLPVAADGKAGGGVEADAVAAVSADGGMVRIMAYSFVNNLHAAGKTPLRMKVKLPVAWKGQDVRVVRSVIDDDANWFDEWRRIRRERGIGDDRFGWSPDDPAPMHTVCGLKSEKDRQMFVEEIEPLLRDHAKLRPVEERIKASADGTVELAASLPVNSVVFFELAARRTWTIAGPRKGSPLRDSGLIGPVRVIRYSLARN